MGQNSYTEKEYFECECGDADHIMRMMYFKDECDFIYLSIHLRQKTFVQRVWHAIKYVCGFRSRYGDFDEFLWGREEAERFKSMLDKYIVAAKDAEQSILDNASVVQR